MSASLSVTKDGIRKSLEDSLSRVNTISSFLQRVIYPQYQQTQIDRWESENSSQGQTWMPLESTYKKYKQKKFESYPGHGDALMIATGKLVNAAIGRSGDAYKEITNEYFVVGINDGAIPYGKWAAERRPIMAFSTEQRKQWTDQIGAWIMRGKS